jgi:hypothetical protein
MYDHFPRVAQTVRPGATSLEVTTGFEYLRRHSVVASIQRPFGKLRLAAEGIFSMRDGTVVESDLATVPYVAGVIGADYQSEQIFDGHYFQLFLDLAAHQPLKGEIAGDTLSRARYPLPLAALARVTYNFGTDLRVSLNGVVSSGPGPARESALDVYISPGIEWIVFDRAKLNLLADILLGDQEGFLGRFRDNTRAVASVEVAF